MKKLVLVTILATIIAMCFGGVAYANFGPHGGYDTDTDACAGCHRAHTSASSVTWNDALGGSHSALLVSSATKMSEFCYACHGDGAPGASTNVLMGTFDGGPAGALGQTTHNDGVGILYRTNSTFNAPLNGGAFSSMSSMHDMDAGTSTAPIWGMGSSVSQAKGGTNLTCTSCHDPHGSSNYRLLKDKLPGAGTNVNRVGGYTASDTPTPWVISTEENYPAGGWKKHGDGALQMASYKPNYTSEELGYIGSIRYTDESAPSIKSMSAWCAGCHEQYDDRSSSYDYGAFESAKSDSSLTMGARSRHRHPVNVTLVAGTGSDNTRVLTAKVTTDAVLPLEIRPGSPNARGAWDFDDYIGCLTCHRAHGTSADMTGWAEASLDSSTSAVTSWFPALDPGEGGVNPNFSSALLRADNRGVCERCHNK